MLFTMDACGPWKATSKDEIEQHRVQPVIFNVKLVSHLSAWRAEIDYSLLLNRFAHSAGPSQSDLRGVWYVFLFSWLVFACELFDIAVGNPTFGNHVDKCSQMGVK